MTKLPPSASPIMGDDSYGINNKAMDTEPVFVTQ